MADLHKQRCPACSQFVEVRPELDDWDAEEQRYRSDVDVLDGHDCPALERTGVTEPAPTRKPAGRRGSGRQTVRNYRYTCACVPPFKVRCGRLDLDARCYACGGDFQREPSDAEVITRKEPAA